MHRVAILALDGVVLSDLAIPLDLFRNAELTGGAPAYDVRLCGEASEVASRDVVLHVPAELDALADADTVIVPGVERPSDPVAPAVLDALRAAGARGARIASVCVGAFTLAATGLLDGLRATTHWRGADALARRYPDVDVDASVLYVDNGRVLTSAGAAAAFDLCLHMIRCDHGAAVAALAARSAVMPLERDGGQAQFIAQEPPVPNDATLEPLLRWLERHAERPLTLEAIAAHAHMSTRTLNRRFREQTGTTPLRWLNRTRLRRAQGLLETTDEPVETIAQHVGFTSTTTFRERFRQLVGTNPQAYRRAFRGSEPAARAPTVPS